ncbi:MAG: FAD-dependent oxidoreductase, partial [Sphingomonadales bacterium]|nr:FAD-dependent oxidoreductase [Sphingomonadales bacterium]
MATIAILGAGIGGVPMAYEMRALASASDRVVVISADTHFRFTPSNPWVAVDWRTPEQVSVDLAPIFHREKIEFVPVAAKKVKPDDNQVELVNGDVIDYDYLVIATGPELAFDEIEGFGPDGGYTSSICTTPHAHEAAEKWRYLCDNPAPIVVGAVQGASCFGP